MSNVSVIIPTMRGREAMLRRLLSTLPDGCERIIVNDENLLLAAKRNYGAKLAHGEYLLFIDDDNYLKDGAIDKLIASFSERIGVIGVVACYSNKNMLVADGGSLRHYVSGFTYGMNTNRRIWELDIYNNYIVDEVANAFMIRRDVFEAVGGFDEKNFPIDLDEADICKRIKNMGYRIVMNPMAICYHSSQTYSLIPDFRRPMNAYFMGRNRVIFQRKHLNPLKYMIYLSVFMPIFVGAYCVCLLYRRKPEMVLHFLKGVRDGLAKNFSNPYQRAST